MEHPRGEFPQFSHSNALIHIAFHFVRERIQYIRRVLEAVESDEFASTHVVVDSNNEEAVDQLTGIISGGNKRIEIRIHRNLEHPFLLTWTHRENMKFNADQYDYFMYLEDDIVVPHEALQRWRADSAKIYPLGYIRGFIRVERDRNNVLICTDYNEALKAKSIAQIAGGMYLRPKNPYHAFWIYERSQLADFMRGPCWISGNCSWPIRERAAAGMIWLNPTQHRAIIPLGADWGILPETLVYHVSNTYGLDPHARSAKLPLTRLLNIGLRGRCRRLLTRWRKRGAEPQMVR